jgi:hypothetical protein
MLDRQTGCFIMGSIFNIENVDRDEYLLCLRKRMPVIGWKPAAIRQQGKPPGSDFLKC